MQIFIPERVRIKETQSHGWECPWWIESLQFIVEPEGTRGAEVGDVEEGQLSGLHSHAAVVPPCVLLAHFSHAKCEIGVTQSTLGKCCRTTEWWRAITSRNNGDFETRITAKAQT